MEPNNQDFSVSEDQQALLEMASELRRLANSALREARKGQSLPCLSNLVAMKPLHSMLISRLASRFDADQEDADAVPDEVESDRSQPGYL
jgi:hypothetical protein